MSTLPIARVSSDVWLLLPVARPKTALQRLERWADMGFKIAVYMDAEHGEHSCVSAAFTGLYAGYYQAVHVLKTKLYSYLQTRCWLPPAAIVYAGDDMEPDPHKGAQVQLQEYMSRYPNLDGIMQATGDRWNIDVTGRSASERICGSPMVGAGWYSRICWGGDSMPYTAFPTCYYHFFGDEELHDVASNYGLLYQNQTITHKHNHWSRYVGKREQHHERAQQHWAKDQQTYQQRRTSRVAVVHDQTHRYEVES